MTKVEASRALRRAFDKALALSANDWRYAQFALPTSNARYHHVVVNWLRVEVHRDQPKGVWRRTHGHGSPGYHRKPRRRSGAKTSEEHADARWRRLPQRLRGRYRLETEPRIQPPPWSETPYGRGQRAS